VKRFVDTFVTKEKHERVQAGLLHRSQQRRIETIQSAYKWIDPSLQSELDGNTGFPQHLHERFGDLRGVMLDDHQERDCSSALRARDDVRFTTAQGLRTDHSLRRPRL
jgi:hypothetical protein